MRMCFVVVVCSRMLRNYSIINELSLIILFLRKRSTSLMISSKIEEYIPFRKVIKFLKKMFFTVKHDLVKVAFKN